MSNKNQDRIKSVGKYTYGQNNIKVYYWGEETWLTIGSFCSIAENIHVFLGGDHRTDWATTYPFGHINQTIFNEFNGKGHPATKGDVKIGNDVWIGANATIMSGVEIGDGACIASNSVVTKSVEPYSIVGGNPAKNLRKRFEDDIIEQLIELSWWDMDDYFINKMSPYLCNPRFVEYLPKLIEYKKMILASVESTTEPPTSPGSQP
jgi:acetyltransferase-like isoleucine patch superfamily enzyme